MFGNKTKQIKEIRDLQKQSLQKNPDDYMVGLYNGLEFALAIMESREPVFEAYVTREPEIKEVKEQKGRTLQSGIKRR